MGLWLGFGLQAVNTELWLQAPAKLASSQLAKKGLEKRIHLKLSCQSGVHYSVPGGGGVRMEV